MDQEFLKELFNEKFAGMTTSMNLQHEIVQVKLNAISEKTVKVESDMKDIMRSLEQVKLNESKHYADCPFVKDFSEFKKKYYEAEKKREEKDKDLNFYMRHPNLTFTGIVVAVLILLFGSSEYQDYKDRNDKKSIQTNRNDISSLNNKVESQSQLK